LADKSNESAQDGLARGAEVAGNLAHSDALVAALAGDPFLFRSEGGLTAERLSFCLRANQPRLRSFNDQISLELSDRRNNAHGHLSCWTGEVYAPKREAVNPDAHIGEPLNAGANVHCIATQSIKFSDYEYVTALKAVDELAESSPLTGGDAAADALADDAFALYLEASAAYFDYLILGSLVGCADAGIHKGSAHFVAPGVSVEGVRILPHVQNLSRVIFGHAVLAWTKSSDCVRVLFCA